jgi:hypothetical protein
MVEEASHAVDRNGVVDIFLLVHAGAHDADLAALGIDQRAAGVAGITSGVELDEFVASGLEVGDHQCGDVPHDRWRADDALGVDDSAPTRIADGEDGFAGHEVMAAAEENRLRHPGNLEFQQRDVLSRQSSHNAEVEALSVDHRHARAAEHDVIVGEEVSVRMDHRGGAAGKPSFLELRVNRDDGAGDLSDETDGPGLAW